MSKKIKCYNCGKECEVIKCSCGAEDWTCENCRVGSGHICEKVLEETKILVDREAEMAELKQQLAEKDKEIEDLKKDNNWYSMWHKKFQKEIEDLKTELETYRPTYLKGNGQCKCAICNQMNWTDWCIKYDGKTYCDECFKQVETRDDKLRHQVCEEIREFVYANWKDIKKWWLVNGKCEEFEEVLDQIEKGE